MTDALLLRPAEAAELLGMSRSKVYELAQSGQLPGVVRFGGSVRIHRAILEAALAEQANGTRRTPAPTKADAQEVRDATARPPQAA